MRGRASPTASAACCSPAPRPCSGRRPPSTSWRRAPFHVKRRAGRALRRRSPKATALNPQLTFESFVIGDTTASRTPPRSLSPRSPAQAYNPLFIYGPPGVGKTHLLHAIGNYIRRYGAGLTVRYTTVEAFTNAFVWAVHGGDIERFKARFRRTDVLLIDDIQFLESKVKTEEEFFHTFNALQDTGSQLVLTSDRLPRDLDALHDRLRERFEAGLVTDIQPPDLATRMTVLRKRAQHDGAAVSETRPRDHRAAHLRQHPRARGRPDPGGRLSARSPARPMTAELADTVLDGFYGARAGRSAARRRARPSLEAIQEAVCEAFAITRDELLSPSRAARLVWPRQVAMYLARENTDLTFPDIARRFGGRNHTTVMHAVKRTAERARRRDREAFDTVRELTERLSGARSPTDRGLTDSVPASAPRMCVSSPQRAGESGTCAHLHTP